MFYTSHLSPLPGERLGEALYTNQLNARNFVLQHKLLLCLPFLHH